MDDLKIEISNAAAVKHLSTIGKRLQRAQMLVKRKRSWQKSEQAMAVLEYEYEIVALRMAINLLELQPPVGYAKETVAKSANSAISA